MILLLLVSFSFAQEFNLLFDTNEITNQTQKQLSDNESNFSYASPAYSDEIKESIFIDEDNLVSNVFSISNYFMEKSSFWLDVYSRYSSKQTIIHDKQDLSLIYFILDFSSINAPDPIIQSKIQNTIASRQVNLLKEILLRFANGEIPKSDIEKKVWKSVNQRKAKINDKKKRFIQLARNTRIQTGQRDSIKNSLLKSAPYLNFINHYLDYFELPRELISMVILESDFNPDSVSKTGATGLWQIMPTTAKSLMPYKKNIIDTRVNPYISTIAAFHLLKQNYSILNGWDLAITAYHSGTTHLLKAKKYLKGKHPPILENIFKFYNSDHHGFASQNYYSEFLALAHLITNKFKAFDFRKEQFESPSRAKIYITKCPIRPVKFFANYKGQLKKLNPHLLKVGSIYNRGTLVVSNQVLPKSKYYALSDNELRRNFPKNLKKFIRNKKCR